MTTWLKRYDLITLWRKARLIDEENAARIMAALKKSAWA